jgi:hypothetical protein
VVVISIKHHPQPLELTLQRMSDYVAAPIQVQGANHRSITFKPHLGLGVVMLTSPADGMAQHALDEAEWKAQSSDPHMPESELDTVL